MSRQAAATAGRASAAAVAGAVTIAAAVVLYLATLDDGLRLAELQGGDLITHQYAQVQGRFSNAPGYPLYTMLGWLWFRVGNALLGGLLSPIQVLSLFSTIWAVPALVLLYVLALDVSGGRWSIAAAATAFYAVTYFFWYYSVSSEQYTSAVFQTLLLIRLAWRWQQSGDIRLLGWIGLVLGTCVANLVTTLAIVPPLLWFLARSRVEIARRPRALVKPALLALLPLLTYAFVYLRGAQHPEWRGTGDWPTTLAWFLDFISTSQGREEMTLALLPLDLSYLRLVVRELTWPVLALGVVGLFTLQRHRAGLLLGALAFYLPLTYVTRTGNWYQIVMPVYPIVVLGVVALAAWISDRLSGGSGRVLTVVATAILIAATGERLATNLPLADLSNRPDDDALCPGRAVLADVYGLGLGETTVLVTYEEALSLEYLRTVFGEGRHVRVVSDPTQEAEADLLSRWAAPLVPAPSSWDSPQVAGQALLRRQPNASSQQMGRPAVRLGPFRVSIAAADRRSSPTVCGGPALLVLLRWQLEDAAPHPFVLSVRALYRGAEVVIADRPAQDDHPPVWGLTSPSSWLTGQTITDSYLLPLPEGAPADGLRLIAYRAEDPASPLWQADLPLTEVVDP